ncbi:MAG TPA: RDD family protein [Bacteroidales bacterium]
MNKIPKSFPNLNESIYAGFWSRLGSLILDLLISAPIIFLLEYINGLSRVNYYYTFIPGLLFTFFYHVYCVRKWGGTPGKLIMNIKILKLNGRPVDWEQAFLREIVSIIYSIVMIIVMIISLSKISDELFDRLDYVQRSVILASLSPISFKFLIWFNNIWVYSELIILLLNKRKMALHDYIASTVVVKGKYFVRLQDWLDRQDGSEIECPGCGKIRIVKRYGNFECTDCNTRFNFSKNGIVEIN